jgi:tetratricopeptide (TPR) repeat protein
MAAATPALRGRHARLGLATRAPLDKTTHAMLLRQLYMAHFESRRFKKAHEVALQTIELRVLVDVAHQDAARAALALGLVDDAVGHLRLAARRSPATRRAFHLWTLGSVLLVAGRPLEAASCLDRAARWGTTEKPLYQAQAALARLRAGQNVGEASTLYRALLEVPAGQGYGRFVLGQLAFELRAWPEARKHLEAFVKRTREGRAGLATSLSGELSLAEATLVRMRTN